MTMQRLRSSDSSVRLQCSGKHLETWCLDKKPQLRDMKEGVRWAGAVGLRAFLLVPSLHLSGRKPLRQPARFLIYFLFLSALSSTTQHQKSVTLSWHVSRTDSWVDGRASSPN
ncbi:hypothetical protein CB0940_00657 [Cercospora beticola]|uniref:Uncharacterized protein n=1 Tax=Cercospora beticola TaxID=122368 RepID=A0A2G5I6X0_CERBT|nr:hypothetical protein CB0940_00657 [Cercospora beticola]PIB00472.1 hypothetical protein CB0940_00657 [Cercospora beticola]